MNAPTRVHRLWRALWVFFPHHPRGFSTRGKAGDPACATGLADMWLHGEYSDTRDGRGAGGKFAMLQAYLLFTQALVGFCFCCSAAALFFFYWFSSRVTFFFFLSLTSFTARRKYMGVEGGKKRTLCFWLNAALGTCS